MINSLRLFILFIGTMLCATQQMSAQRVVYKDGTSTINGNWNGTLGAGSVAQITTDAPYEGGQHYRFNYSFGTGSFDGFGLQFYSGANFSGKTYLRIAYLGTGVAHTMQIRLSDGTNTTTVYDVGELSSTTYQVANVPIASLPGIGSVNLNAVTSIQISAKPNTGTGGTGTLYFDAIELIDDPNVLVTSRIVYKDGASTINGNWNGTLGAGSVAAITTDAPYEGGQHYRFNYSFGTGSFDGFGLQFYSGANFSGKTYLRIAYRGTGVAHTMQIRLSDGTNTTTVYDVGELSSSTYQVANLAIASFPGIGSVNLNAVTSIQISAKPNTGTGGTGSLFFDAIELTNSTLPIELLSFKATPLSKSVQLDWKTASEKNARHFDVERGLDGKNFSSIGTIKASGTSNTLLTYNFDDENPLNGLTYYRLRQVDFDGTTAFSGIVSVNRNKGTKLVLAPNPAQNTIAVTLAGNEQRANLTVYDLLGKAVLTKTMEGSSANLDLSALPSSTYLLEIVSNGQVFREKLVKN